jgi:hypothetical protein
MWYWLAVVELVLEMDEWTGVTSCDVEGAMKSAGKNMSELELDWRWRGRKCEDRKLTEIGCGAVYKIQKPKRIKNLNIASRSGRIIILI